MSVDPLVFTDRWRVRQYELDVNGHVNNAVYLNYAEEMAVRHVEATGFGAAWAATHQGGWVVRRNEIVYHVPALAGDELELTVWVELVKGARAQRRTAISRLPDKVLLAEVVTEWVWVRLSDGRPSPVPSELVAVAAAVTAATLSKRALRRPGT